MSSKKGLNSGRAVPPNATGVGQKPKLIVVTAGGGGTESVAHLPSQMYDVEQVFTFEQLIDLISRSHYELIVIDKSSVDMDGTSLLRSLMSNDNQSLVMVVSETDDEIDRIIALELGADDCVSSSCGPRELKSRVSALLRRYQKVEFITTNRLASENSALGGEVSHKNWILNRSRCQLYSPSGDLVYLTSAEFEILSVLFSDPGAVKDRSSLRNIEVDNDEYGGRALDVFVSRLRKKMSSYGGQDLIETVRGRGYRLSESKD